MQLKLFHTFKLKETVENILPEKISLTHLIMMILLRFTKKKLILSTQKYQYTFRKILHLLNFKLAFL